MSITSSAFSPGEHALRSAQKNEGACAFDGDWREGLAWVNTSWQRSRESVRIYVIMGMRDRSRRSIHT